MNYSAITRGYLLVIIIIGLCCAIGRLIAVAILTVALNYDEKIAHGRGHPCPGEVNKKVLTLDTMQNGILAVPYFNISIQ